MCSHFHLKDRFVSDPEEPSNTLVVTYEFHVVRSPAYGVPVLYLTAQDASVGNALNGAQVSRAFVRGGRGDTAGHFSQSIHPLLGLPAWMLHPCHTDEVLKTITKGRSRG